MNWVDIAIIIALIIFAYEGFGKLIFVEIFELASFLVAFLFSLRFYNLLASQLQGVLSLPHSFSNVLGFIAVWYIIEIVLFIGVKNFHKISREGTKLPAENFLSMIPAFCRGIVFVSIILVLIGTFPIQPQIKSEVQGSKIGSFILAQTYQVEAPLKNVFGGLSNDTLTFLTVKPTTTENVSLGFQTVQFSFDEQLEFAMINLVNKERLKVDLPPLSYDAKLQEIARAHSADMFERGYFSHYTPEGHDLAFRAKAASIDFLVIGENLAYAPSLELAHQGLMNSPGHRANILSPDYHRIGIGVANGGGYGIMFTQEFEN